MITKYAEQRDCLKNYYEKEKIGNQNLYTDQTKLFKPIIESQKESSKEIQDKIVSNQENLSNTLVPYTNELKRRNDQIEELQSLPYYNIPQEIEDAPQSTPKKEIIIDVNGELLNQTHLENLTAMNLELPSKVQEKGMIENTLNEIKRQNRSLGQRLGKTGEKRSEAEKEIFKSQKVTLGIYEGKIKKLQGAQEFIKTGKGLKKREHKPCKQKRGKGRPRKYPDAISYNTSTDLCEKLNELLASKKAGNTGVDNQINHILDELLNTGSIDQNYYNNLYKSIFPNYK